MQNNIIIFSGTSMSPFLRSGDRLYVRNTPWDRLKIGDLVMVEASAFDRPILHRLVGWRDQNDGRQGVLKGDNLIYKDRIFLTPKNYKGKVWARERNGQFLDLNRLSENSRARIAAFFSLFNLTSGVLRLKIKETLKRILPQIPVTKIIERQLLENANYYIFTGPGDRKRLCMTWRGLNIGEVVFQNNPPGPPHSAVFSVFSALISAENLLLYSGARFPELFQPGTPNHTETEA